MVIKPVARPAHSVMRIQSQGSAFDKHLAIVLARLASESKSQAIRHSLIVLARHVQSGGMLPTPLQAEHTAVVTQHNIKISPAYTRRIAHALRIIARAITKQWPGVRPTKRLCVELALQYVAELPQ